MWSDVNASNYPDTVRLLGLIDIVASYIFEGYYKDRTFNGWTCKRHYNGTTEAGVLIAYACDDSSHVYISFDTDVPASAENEIVEVLKTDKNAHIWCRAENKALIELVAKVTAVNPYYWSREMSVTKESFLTWNKPIVPEGFNFKGYDSSKHENYINLLEEAMSHISTPGTFVAESEGLRSSWSHAAIRNHFLSLWHGEDLVGISHSNGLELTRLAVSEAYRRKGFGYLLLYNTLDHIYRLRREAGLVCLYVSDYNEHAYRFYLRAGMEVTGHVCRFVV